MLTRASSSASSILPIFFSSNPCSLAHSDTASIHLPRFSSLAGNLILSRIRMGLNLSESTFFGVEYFENRLKAGYFENLLHRTFQTGHDDLPLFLLQLLCEGKDASKPGTADVIEVAQVYNESLFAL